MASNASRGARWKARSKRYLQQQGYEVGDMEILRVVYTPNGMVPTKRDQWASDLIAQRADEDAVLFVQVKGGAKVNTAEAKRKFGEHVFARCTRRVIHIWRPMARTPEIIVCQ